MHCPQCGQQPNSDELRFCSRCGFPLSGVIKLVEAGGELPVLKESDSASVRSPRRKGIEQGAILIFSAVLLIPLVNLIASPYHEALIFFFLIGGILRALFALVFQEGLIRLSKPNGERLDLRTASGGGTLLPESAKKTESYGLPQTGTSDAVLPPASVTENTTSLLKEKNTKKGSRIRVFKSSFRNALRHFLLLPSRKEGGRIISLFPSKFPPAMT